MRKCQLGLWIKADGTEMEVSAKHGKFSLEELQQYVGGYIELVRIDGHRYLYADEEGRLKDNPVINHKACDLTGQLIVGNVIVLGRKA